MKKKQILIVYITGLMMGGMMEASSLQPAQSRGPVTRLDWELFYGTPGRVVSNKVKKPGSEQKKFGWADKATEGTGFVVDHGDDMTSAAVNRYDYRDTDDTFGIGTRTCTYTKDEYPDVEGYPQPSQGRLPARRGNFSHERIFQGFTENEMTLTDIAEYYQLFVAEIDTLLAAAALTQVQQARVYELSRLLRIAQNIMTAEKGRRETELLEREQDVGASRVLAEVMGDARDMQVLEEAENVFDKLSEDFIDLTDLLSFMDEHQTKLEAKLESIREQRSQELRRVMIQAEMEQTKQELRKSMGQFDTKKVPAVGRLRSTKGPFGLTPVGEEGAAEQLMSLDLKEVD